MRSRTVFRALCGTALAASMGCGGNSHEQTDLAKLSPPSAAAIAKAKATRLTGPRPKFGAPAKSERVEPTTVLP
jgi:ABC-type uncharacterized transport system auxiliary subunit